MKTNRPYHKFALQQKRIQELEKTNARFKRIYDEYETLSDELWNLESSEEISVTDDFLNSIKQQTSYLEDEIKDWLMEDFDEE